jgi:hypothetical protein
MDELEQQRQAGSREDTSGKRQVNTLLYLRGIHVPSGKRQEVKADLSLKVNLATYIGISDL